MAKALTGLHPTVRRAAEKALKLARARGLSPEITSTYRSTGEQAYLYQAYKDFQARPWWKRITGRSSKSPFPANPPGLSAHQYGMAFDSVVPDAHMPLWTSIRESVGFRVPPNDIIHAEVPEWQRYVR